MSMFENVRVNETVRPHSFDSSFHKMAFVQVTRIMSSDKATLDIKTVILWNCNNCIFKGKTPRWPIDCFTHFNCYI